MTRKKNSKRSKNTKASEVTQALRINWALESFTPRQLASSKKQWRVPRKEVTRGLDVSASVFSKAIKEAFVRGEVKVVRAAEDDPIDPEEIQLDEYLATQLEQRLDDVRVQVVVTGDDESSASGEREARRSEERKSDDIHRRLGARLAHALAEMLFVPGGPHTLGVGGGRAVWYTVEALRRGRALRWGKSKIVSLSGRVHAKDHAQTVSGGLDADLHAMLLEFAFKDAKSLIVGCDITGPAPRRDAKKALELSPIGSEWKNNRPDVAIVGVGALLKGHRFFDFDPENPGALEPVAKDLVELVRLTKKYTDLARPYCVVGDLANRLFFVGTDPEKRPPPKDEEKIKQLIGEVNSRLVNVSDEQLKEIDHLIVLAGSRTKAPALTELLTNKAYKVRSLYIDSATAKTLVELLDKVQPAA